MINSNEINKPLVSIIVPVYKVEKYLDRCIKSILNQTYKNIEVILVDDGSPDGCPVMCDLYAKNDIRVSVIHKSNGGLSSARNVGILNAKGDYLLFIDSDDWVTKDMVEYMINLMLDKVADIVSVSYILTSDEKQRVTEENHIKTMNRDEALEYFLDIGMRSRVSDYPVCIKMFKKNIFEGIEFPIGTLYEDYTTNVLLIKKCHRYVKSSKICYFYFQGSQSIVRSKYKKQDEQLLSQCVKVCEYVENEKDSIRKIAREKLGRSYLSLLLKIAIYGFDDNISSDEKKYIINDLTKKLRKEFFTLLRSRMPISRKVFLIILCIDYHPLCVLRKVMK